MNARKLVLILAAGILPAQTMKAPDITREPTLYVVPYAHLDTQWRWEFPQTISEYLLKTMRVNFDYIDKYPHYVFNWSGSNRYRLMKEYFPRDYARMKQYVAAGRWFPAGSSVEEGDVNLPNAEGIFRQILYGNDWFRQEFGKASAEYILPDCFGFPASLPSILAHSGLKGFSTQKLSSAWQPAPHVGGPNSPEKTPEGIPFNVGLWEGPDGKTVLAALNPGNYSGGIHSDLSKTPPSPDVEPAAPAGTPRPFRRMMREEDWVKRIGVDGEATGVFADYHYIGTGDIGGAVDEESVKLLEAMVTKGEAALPAAGSGRPNSGPTPRAPQGPAGPPVKLGDGPVHIVAATSEQMFLDIQPGMMSRMPRYQGDLELINHSAGSLTSQAYHRRWVRQTEVLADAAEKASVASAWLGGRTYPQQRLNDAWTLALSGHFHDTAGGTATPRAYEFAQNDDVIAMNQFAGVLTSATQSVASALDTQSNGVPVIVFNSLNVPREDIVEASVQFPGGMPAGVRVTGPDGQTVPSQLSDGKVLFLARVPSVAYAVYHVEAAPAGAETGELSVSESSLENSRYRVKLDAGGGVASIFDKSLKRELLAAPVRLAISEDSPAQWPAWNMDFNQEQAAPRAYVAGPAKVRVIERGPARVSIEVSRDAEGSRFVQTVRLSSGGAGDRVEFSNSIDWRTLSANLKAVFPLAATSPMATYNQDIGTLERPNAYDRQFEVGSHQWIDLTDQSGAFGATILTDVKNGSDKRDDRTIRLTLIRTPGFPKRTQSAPGPLAGMRRPYSDQLNQDWGHHEILFGIAGHRVGWRSAQADWTAYRLNAPLVAFQTTPHAGTLGREFSLFTLSNPRIRVLALKKAERTDEIVVRMVEMDGKPVREVRLHFAAPLVGAREINAQEQPVGPAPLVRGDLEVSFSPYQTRTFALKPGRPPAHLVPPVSRPVSLQYDLAAASNDDTQSQGGFDGRGNALPAEMLPVSLDFGGVKLQLAAAGTGKPNALIARGQRLAFPSGAFNRVYVLAAAVNGDQPVTFEAGGASASLKIEDWGGFVGQWDTRIWNDPPDKVPVRAFGPPTAGAPPREVPLRKDWAVSANHAPWDLQDRGSPNWSPQYPQDYKGLRPGFVKRADIGWYASHHHTREGLNQPYAYSYLFVYPLTLSRGSVSLKLPDNPNVRILAVSVSREEPSVVPVTPLYDTLGGDTPGPVEPAHP